MKKEDFVLNANFILLKTEINALKKLLTSEQKIQFNNEMYAQQLEKVTNYKDNEFFSKSEFEELFKKSLIEY